MHDAHSIFYTSLAPSAASWDTSSDKSESQLKFFNLEKRLRFSLCMRARWTAISGEEKRQLACRRHTFRSCQLAASPTCDSGEIQTERRNKKKSRRGGEHGS